MKITMEDYHLPYIMTKRHAFFPAIMWQRVPLFGIVWKPKPWKQISEYGVIIFGLWFTIIHEWWDEP